MKRKPVTTKKDLRTVKTKAAQLGMSLKAAASVPLILRRLTVKGLTKHAPE